MIVASPLVRAALLAAAIVITALAALFALPDQPIPFNTPGDATVNSVPAIRISLAGEADAEPVPMPDSKPNASQPPPKPEPVSQAKPEPEPEPEIVTAPEPQPTKPPTPAPEKQAPSAQDQAEASTPESEPAPGQVADPKPGETAQNSQVELNAGTSQATDSYLSKLSRHLSRFYEYPRRARRLGQEGVSVIVFRFQRNGTLIGHYLQDGSGHELLDKAALDMLKQAEPLPPVPEAMVGKTFSYALPVRFSLR